MRFALGAMAAVVVAVVGGMSVWMLAGGGEDPPPPATATAALSPTPFVCGGTIGWGDAVACEGWSLTVKGPVAGASYRPTISGSPTFINLGNDFPDTSRLQVTVWGRCRDNFATAPEEAFKGKVLYVTGTVEVREGVPQMEVCSANQISVE